MVGPSGQPTQLRPTPPPTVAPRRGRRRWLIGAAAAVVLVVGGTVAATQLGSGSSPQQTANPLPPTTTQTTPAAPPAPPTLAPAALPGLLPSVDTVRAAVGGADLGVDQTSPKPLDSSANVTEKECLGVLGPGEKATYAGSGYQGFQLEVVRDRADESKLANASIVVATFLSAEQAKQFFDAQPPRWAQCADRRVTFDYGDGSPRSFHLGSSALTADGVLTMPVYWVGVPQQQCQRAMVVRNNVAIDVWACRVGPGDPAVMILRDIVAKIAQS